MDECFRVWCPDHGHERDDAKRIDARDGRGAAEYYAENLAGFSGDPFDCIELHVEDGRGERRVFEVDVEVAPVFVAREKKPKEARGG